MTAGELAFALLWNEEAYRQYAYNDLTGKCVTCQTTDPKTTGNLTWLVGLNLETEGCPELAQVVLKWSIAKREAAVLAEFPHYAALDTIRQAALLDIAFNVGAHGLMGFHRMLAAIVAADWATAAKECHVGDPRLEGRYEHLAYMLEHGALPPDLAAKLNLNSTPGRHTP